MSKIYKDNPDNFSSIEPFIISDSKEVASKIVVAERCYFYDTCTFRKHMLLPHIEYLTNYIKKTKGIIVITRCVIMELCSNDGRLWREHINFIKKLFLEDIEVLVVYEEDILEVVSLCYSANSKINAFLSFAVRVAACKVGTVMDTLNNNSVLKKDVLSGAENSNALLYETFFQQVRKNKETQDNLGEELIVICMHILSNIPENFEYKYILLSEDKGAVSLLHKARKNIYEHSARKCMSGFTTAKLAQLMYEENCIYTKEQILEVLKSGNTGDNIKVVCLGKFDLEKSEKTMTCEEIAEEIATQGKIQIIS